ncbi:MAG TPA: phosphatase PAP2 family protein, partial [archaeon]|nr:phosphatase PAP2 family protein [archaeon]
AVTTLVVVGAVVGGAKDYFKLERPSSDLVRVIQSEQSHSFPSGHSALSVAEGVTLSLFTGRKVDALLAVIALLVVVSRLYLGAHFLEDVVGGAVIGLAIGLLATNVFKGFEERLSRAEFTTKRIALLALVVASAFVFASNLNAFSEASYTAGIVSGYYAGLLFYNAKHLKQTKASWLKAVVPGVVALAAWTLAVAALPSTLKFAAGIIAGLWVTWFYPMALRGLSEKVE